MAKIELNTDVTNYQTGLPAINDNFRKLEEVLQDEVLFRDNPEGEPNQLESDIDVNGKILFNLPDPTTPSQAATKKYVDGFDFDLSVVKVVSDNIDSVIEVADISEDVSTVASISEDVQIVAEGAAEVVAVGQSIANVESVSDNLGSVNIVASDIESVVTVADSIAEVIATGQNIEDITIVADNIDDVGIVAASIPDIFAAESSANLSAATAIAQANAAAGYKNEAQDARDAAQAASIVAQDARDDAVAVVYEGEASLDPGPGKIPVARASGAIDTAWIAESELPKIKPTLLLDFCNSKTLDPRATYTCASPVPYYDGKTVVKAEENLLLNSASLATQSRTVIADDYTLSFSGTGTVTLTGASTAGPLVGTGTDRVELTFTPSAGSLTLTVSGDVLEAQLEARAFATAYTPTTAQPITSYQPKLLEAPANTPTITHDPVTGECLGLQVYGQATNLLTWSDDFTNASWINSNALQVGLGLVAPNGLLGQKIIAGTSNGINVFYKNVGALSAGGNTFVAIAKAGEYKCLKIMHSAEVFGYFDLTAGVATKAGVNAREARMKHLGNGWYLCALVSDRTTAAYYGFGGQSTPTSLFAGDGKSGIFISRAGWVAGDFNGIPPKTEGSQVTRAAATITPHADSGSLGEGTLYAEYAASSAVASIGTAAIPAPANRTGRKTAVAFDSTSTITVTDNGTAATTAGSAGASALTLGQVNGTLEKIAVYPQKLTATEAGALTS